MISVTIDDKTVRRAFAVAPTLLARELSAEVNRFTVARSSLFNKQSLRAKDDRNRGDFLMRRPRTSMGLRRVTGQIANDYYADVAAPVSEIGKIRATTGFRTGKGARIARVHELGTIRYGGSLPDIVPKRAKYLAVPVRSGNASRSVKARIVRLSKVGIPPRLGFVAFWTSKATVADLTGRALAAARRAIKKAASRG